jgi:hypothetical protein
MKRATWNGVAGYLTLDIGGAQNKDAVKNIANDVAFWKGVSVG